MFHVHHFKFTECRYKNSNPRVYTPLKNGKAIAAHEEGEKMVIDEEIMLLQSLVAKLSAYLRSGITSQLPSDLLRELDDKQKAIVSKALMS